MAVRRRANHDPTLGPEVGDHLRFRRDSSRLTQAKLAEFGEKLGMRFDNSWVSKWERQGPKDTFLKALAYLKLVNADLEMMQEMLRCEVEIPERCPRTVEEVLKKGKSLHAKGKVQDTLGLFVSALRNLKHSGSDSAKLYLSASIAARRADLIAFADYFVEQARREVEGDDSDGLRAKILVESANVAADRGRFRLAMSWLDEIADDALADPSIAALVTQARAFVVAEAEEQGEESSRGLYELSLSMHSAREGDLAIPLLLTQIASARAEEGDARGALDAVRQAEKYVADNPLHAMRFQRSAGHVFAAMNRYSDAIAAFKKAEEEAQRLGKPLRLFEIRLEMLELSIQHQDKALSQLLNRRLEMDRQQVQLPANLERRFENLRS